MEIHSSSLAFYPLAPNRINGAQESNAGTTTNKEAGNDPNQQRVESPTEPASASNRFPQKTREVARPVQADFDKFPLNSRTQKALNTYIDTVNQTNDDQQSQTAGIDFFV